MYLTSQCLRCSYNVIIDDDKRQCPHLKQAITAELVKYRTLIQNSGFCFLFGTYCCTVIHFTYPFFLFFQFSLVLLFREQNISIIARCEMRVQEQNFSNLLHQIAKLSVSVLVLEQNELFQEQQIKLGSFHVYSFL